ncbi:MAG: hypothetical protein KDJ90_09485 [Nitratireductor sp.]|nr:hypothetical protein [Nitratireductor sp.]
MIFEVPLTEGNFGKSGRNNHVYIDTFVHALPKDIVGGSSRAFPAPRKITLEYDGYYCETDIPTDRRTGKPRPFFRARGFIGRFFDHVGARPGDVVVFELVSPYRLRMSLK